MKMKTMKQKLALMCLVLGVLSSASGCTIIRYVTDDNNDDQGDPPPPKIVDMLILIELDRNTAQLATDYQEAILSLQGGLATAGVTVRKKAVAPLYRRTGNAVPLIYGEGEEDGQFNDLAEAISFYTLNDNGRYLPDRVNAEGENLATLGMNLDSASIYHPTSAATDASPYFTVAGDGLIVVQMTAKARACGYDDAGCKLNGQAAGAYFTAEAGGKSSWLELPNATGLAKDRVFFLNIATLEGGTDDDVDRRCTGKVGLNELIINSLEASPFVYYEDFAEDVSQRGGWSKYMETCDALSASGDVKLAAMGKEIGSELRK